MNVPVNNVPRAMATPQAAPHSGGVPAPSAPKGFLRTGAAARAALSDADAASQAKSDARQLDFLWPRRFNLKHNPGPQGMDNQGQYIILDAQCGPVAHEHEIWETTNQGKRFPVNAVCIKELGHCPLCPPASEKDSAFVMYITVLNMMGYWSTKQNRQIAPTRELLVVKQHQQPLFYEMEQAYGGLRGLMLRVKREGQRSPKIGDIDPVFQKQKFTDAELQAYLANNNAMGPETRMDRRLNQEVEKYPAGHMMQPYDYASFVIPQTEEQLRARFPQVAQQAPVGSMDGGQDHGQWGHAAPGQAIQPPAFGAAPNMGQPVAGGGIPNPNMGQPMGQPATGLPVGPTGGQTMAPVVPAPENQMGMDAPVAPPVNDGLDPALSYDTPLGNEDAQAGSATVPDPTTAQSQAAPSAQVADAEVVSETPAPRARTAPATQGSAGIDDEIPFKEGQEDAE